MIILRSPHNDVWRWKSTIGKGFTFYTFQIFGASSKQESSSRTPLCLTLLLTETVAQLWPRDTNQLATALATTKIRVPLIKTVARQLTRLGQNQMSSAFLTVALAPMVFLSNTRGVVSRFIQPSTHGYNMVISYINKLHYTGFNFAS